MKEGRVLMALVRDTTSTGSITFVDNDGNKARMSVLFLSSLTDVEALATMDALVDAALLVSNAAVASYSFTTGFTDNEIDPALISEASDVEGKLVFQFRAGNGQTVKTELPSPRGELIVAGTNVADPANAAVAAFIAAMTSGNVGANNGPTTNTGVDLDQAILPIRKIHRASSKG